VPFVLDASSTLPWCFRDEASVYTDRLLQLAYDGERIFVPPHWPAEILNGLLRAVRRKRLSEVEAKMFLTSLLAYDIVVDQNSLDEQWSELMHVAETYALSAYDAAYLSLALRMRVPLATQDERLQLAAKIEGLLFASVSL
jgi:predicted nucleic acid-binding protein